MLYPPTRLSNLSLIGRHCVESLLVQVEDRPISPITYCVCFNLDSFFQRLNEHRQQIAFLSSKEPGRARCIGIRLQQGGAARSQRSVHIRFDPSDCEMIVEGA